MSDSISSGQGAKPADPTGNGSAPNETDLPHVEAPALLPDRPETVEAAPPEPQRADADAAEKRACGTAMVLAHPQPQAQTKQTRDQPSAKSSSRSAPSLRTFAALLAGAALLGGAAGALGMAGVLRAESASAGAYSGGVAE